MRFASGSRIFDPLAEIFTFDAVIGGEPVKCVMSVLALAELTQEEIDEDDPTDLFDRFESDVFELARMVYVRRGLNENGTLGISMLDVSYVTRH
jgi:hypothetical protein